MNKIINYFFEDEEKELIQYYSMLIKVIAISTIISILAVVI